MSVKYKGKTITAKDIFITVGFFAFMGILTFVSFKAAFTPIPSITSEEFSKALEENGYSYYDSTSEWLEANPGWSFDKCTSYTDSTLRLDFLVLGDAKIAMGSFSAITSKLTSIYTSHRDNAVDCPYGSSRRANFIYRTLKADGMYYHLMRIDNTIFYAISTTERENEVLKIAKEIGYIG